MSTGKLKGLPMRERYHLALGEMDELRITNVKLQDERDALRNVAAAPIPMRLPCPACGTLHLDDGNFASKPHHTHACQTCGEVWRPAIVDTIGVRFLPGFKNS
jgi:hypothetical protein